MNLIETIEFDVLGDDRGCLVSLEENNNIPFDIRRVYYIFSTSKGVARGFHAHYKLKQVAICLRGSCEIMMDDGKRRETILMDRENLGLVINPMQWHEMSNFTEDCVLMVIADGVYDESDYIRSYTKFIEELAV